MKNCGGPQNGKAAGRFLTWWRGKREALWGKLETLIDAPGYRYAGAPTAEETIADLLSELAELRQQKAAAREDGELALERARRRTAEQDLAQWRRASGPQVPHLTPASIERLAILAEECGEVQQAVGKVLRHGWESSNPCRVAAPTNRVALEREVGDLMAVLRLLYEAREMRPGDVHAWKRKKEAGIGRWLHHRDGLAGCKTAGSLWLHHRDGLAGCKTAESLIEPPVQGAAPWGCAESVEVLPQDGEAAQAQ